MKNAPRILLISFIVLFRKSNSRERDKKEPTQLVIPPVDSVDATLKSSSDDLSRTNKNGKPSPTPSTLPTVASVVEMPSPRPPSPPGS